MWFWLLKIMEKEYWIMDLPRVFEYGFTGADRQKQYSTGIGLYLCKKLCNKMNLDIKIESQYKKFTKVKIIFPKTNLYRQ